MSREEVLTIVNSVFHETLDNDELVIEESTSANDIEEWDSLTHIQLVVGMEKKFKLRFTAIEIQSWKNVGEMMNSIMSKLNE